MTKIFESSAHRGQGEGHIARIKDEELPGILSDRIFWSAKRLKTAIADGTPVDTDDAKLRLYELYEKAIGGSGLAMDMLDSFFTDAAATEPGDISDQAPQSMRDKTSRVLMLDTVTLLPLEETTE
jgi:hypothetical protein